MIAVELYRPDELNLYAESKYPLQSIDIASSHKHQSEEGKAAAQAFISQNSFKLDDDEEEDEGGEEVKEGATNKKRKGTWQDDPENPYLKEITKSSMKKQ